MQFSTEVQTFMVQTSDKKVSDHLASPGQLILVGIIEIFSSLNFKMVESRNI